jgi:NAD(P)H-hydrate epimerase
MEFVTAGEMRDWERGKDTLELMENAGKAIAEELGKRARGSVVFVCGPGNNGGDGFTAARHLPGAKVCAPFESKTEEARANRARLDAERFVDSFKGFDCIVDCLLGTGAKGELREPMKSMVEQINAEKKMGALVVSVDVPTGLDGSLEVEADLTICLQFAKQGMQGKKFVVRRIAPERI